MLFISFPVVVFNFLSFYDTKRDEYIQFPSYARLDISCLLKSGSVKAGALFVGAKFVVKRSQDDHRDLLQNNINDMHKLTTNVVY